MSLEDAVREIEEARMWRDRNAKFGDLDRVRINAEMRRRCLRVSILRRDRLGLRRICGRIGIDM